MTFKRYKRCFRKVNYDQIGPLMLMMSLCRRLSVAKCEFFEVPNSASAIFIFVTYGRRRSMWRGADGSDAVRTAEDKTGKDHLLGNQDDG